MNTVLPTLATGCALIATQVVKLSVETWIEPVQLVPDVLREQPVLSVRIELAQVPAAHA